MTNTMLKTRPARSPARKPPVVISQADYDRIAALVAANRERNPASVQEISDEIERARVVRAAALPPDVVAMHSRVIYRDNATGTEREVRLVYPNEADIAEGRISVLTPIGAALIGLRKGQTIGWRTRMGEQRDLTIIEVKRPDQIAPA